jgi:hypothetical protein
VKICSGSHPWATARSTALETPPATDICAPMRITHYKVRLKADCTDAPALVIAVIINGCALSPS